MVQTNFLPKIQVINENFEIPQLIKTRRIAALLPHNYHETDRRYPVLYLQDGQNLFDDYAPYGNWALDKKLAELSEHGYGDFIVIAIDHAEHERVKEFTPSIDTKLGIGEGKKYVRFLADTLKPYIDQHFRTVPDRNNTGIGGSSMGALVSIYAGLMYPEVYGKLMIFSPSLWVTSELPDLVQTSYVNQDSKVYLYAGGSESQRMVPDVMKFVEAVGSRNGQINFQLSIDPNGQHNEYFWGKEFPKAIRWLYYNV